MLSQDQKVFDEGLVRDRMISYGTIFEELVLVVFGVGERKESQLAPHVRAVFPGGKNKLHALVRGAFSARKEGRAINAVVLSAQDPFFIGLAGLWAAWRLAVPFQAQLHTDCFSPGFRGASMRRKIESMIAGFVLGKSSCVRVVSERIARSIKNKTSAPVTVLPIFFPQPPPISGLVPKEFRGNFTVLAASRLTPEKQLHLLIDAMQFFPSGDLIIVGDGPLRHSLEARVKQLKLEDRIQFAGWKKNLAPYFEHAAAFASISQYEGYGLSLAEAAFYALPIVATDAGIAGDILKNENDCLLVTPDARAIARALTRYQEDHDFARAMGLNAKSKMEKYMMSESAYLARYGEAMHTCIT